MDSIGDRLREERLRRAWTLSQIAETTKISQVMLEALEGDDFKRLPGAFLARSFARQYAQHLQIYDEEFEATLLEQLPAEPTAAPTPQPPPLAYPVPPMAGRKGHGRGNWLSGLVGFVLIFAACSGIYWFLTRETEPRSEPREARQAPPQQPAPAPKTPASAPSSRTAAQEAAPAPSAAPAAGGEIVKSSAPPGEPAAVRLEVQAKGEVWVRVVGDRQLLYEGILQAGQRLRTDGAEYLRARFGKPEVVQMTWNSQAIGEVGTPGRPVTLEFTAQNYRVVPPPPPEESEPSSQPQAESPTP